MASAVPAHVNNSSSNGQSTNWGNASFTSHTADEATVDAYAVKVLEDASPPDVAVDAEYLGSYITGVLRAEEVSASSQVEAMPDYENVLELLQEHCSMTQIDAKITLQKIAEAVVTGIVPRYTAVVASPSLGPFAPPSSLNGLSALQLLESVNVEEAVEESHNNSTTEFTSLQVDTVGGTSSANDTSSNNNNTLGSNTGGSNQQGTALISPVQPDNLIPFDLLGAIDDEDAVSVPISGPATATTTTTVSSAGSLEDEFPSLAVAAASKISKKASRSSRSRQGSIDESSLLSDHSSKKVSPNLQPVQQQQQQHQPYYYSLDEQQQHDPATMLQMACDMLQQMNPEMGHDAIFHAATMAHSDVGVAQYLMDCAMTAPPVCRHLLHAGCYRSDCQFSHDLEGHTCAFWVRGRCTKGSSCPFLHGYNEKWLVQLEEQQQQAVAEMEQQGYHHQEYPSSYYHHHDGSSSWEQQLPQQTMTATTTTTTTESNNSTFANIASQGYNNQTCFQARSASNSLQQQQQDHPYYEETKFSVGSVPTVRIPQDVWNPHERRDASAFHIADPMERYHEVSRIRHESGRNQPRTDVIDLHFQSQKTYATVLHQVLPEKLASESQGVWIVTGTGHHVGNKTHQKGGGILESAVMGWLAEQGYDFWKGKDRNGHGGALFVKSTGTNGRGGTIANQ